MHVYATEVIEKIIDAQGEERGMEKDTNKNDINNVVYIV